MAEKRYYWLKLYKDFFTSKRIKMLRSIRGGDTYTIIYLKMQLKALDTDGYLYFDGYMNDFAEELALDIDETVENVKMTIQFLLNVGLLESNTDGTDYKLTYMDNLIGSETASSQRVRDYRNRQKEVKTLQCNKNVTQVQRIGNAEIEKEIEKEKRKNIWVAPTLEQIQEYCKSRHNNVDAQRFFDYYEASGWKDSKGNKVKNWKQKVITWEKHDSAPVKTDDYKPMTESKMSDEFKKHMEEDGW